MSASVPNRPTGIAVTAWMWIVTGAFMIFSGLMGGVAFYLMQHSGAVPVNDPNLPPGFALVFSLFDYFGVMLALQSVAAVVAIWAGIALLALKAWARTTIEVLSWLALLYCIGFGILWVYLWISMTGQMPQGGAPFDPTLFRNVGLAIGIVVTAAFAAPMWVMIRYLRGAEARSAVAQAAEAR